MKIGIVTDSTCDLPRSLIEQHELEVIPCILVLEGTEYVDGTGMSREEFYRRLPALRTQPTTAAPSIGRATSSSSSTLSASNAPRSSRGRAAVRTRWPAAGRSRRASPRSA